LLLLLLLLLLLFVGWHMGQLARAIICLLAHDTRYTPGVPACRSQVGLQAK
jgi:hypothetical protein